MGCIDGGGVAARVSPDVRGLIHKVPVISHSQGAAIVHQVLNEHERRSDRRTGLVTLG
jgi:hypothetical protein